MDEFDTLLARPGVPTALTWDVLDARELPPPQPLQRTLEAIAALDDDNGLVQRNDRAPQFLYPRLAERGFDYETIETDAEVQTAIWRA